MAFMKTQSVTKKKLKTSLERDVLQRDICPEHIFQGIESSWRGVIALVLVLSNLQLREA